MGEVTDFLSDLRENADALIEQGRTLGMIQERQAIADWVQSHVSWMPGGPEWATSLLKYLAERTEQGGVTLADSRSAISERGGASLGSHPDDSEPLDERCGLWFIADGQRAQCFEPAHHTGAHASFEEMEAWRQIREQARWYPDSDGSALWARYLDGDR